MDLVVHPEKNDEQGRNGHCLVAFFTARVIYYYRQSKWKIRSGSCEMYISPIFECHDYPNKSPNPSLAELGLVLFF